MSEVHAIGDPDSVDIVGVRKDGGIDLVLTVESPIGSSPEVLALFERKLKNYVRAGTSEKFLSSYGRSPRDRVTIYVSCAFDMSEAAIDVVNRAREYASSHGLVLELRKQMGVVQ